MAIERMKCVWLFAPRGQARRILDRIAGMGLCHIVDTGPTDAGEMEALGIEHVYPDVAELERRVQLLRETFETLSPFHKTAREFLENFITTPLEVSRAQVSRTLKGLAVEKLHTEARQLEQRYTAAKASFQKAEDALKALSALAGLQSIIPGKKAQRRTAAFLGIVLASKMESLHTDERLTDTWTVSIVAEWKRKAVIQAVCAAEDRSIFEAVLKDYDVELIAPENETVTVNEYLAHRRQELNHCRTELKALKAGLSEMAKANLRTVEIALGYWEERLRIASAAGLLAESRRMTIMRGYVRTRDVRELEHRIAEELPEVGIKVMDPAQEETVPVSLKNPKLFAPAQFLISMLGMPNYFTFDPTPVVFFNFVIFFGICFGDLFYGIGLIVLGFWLAKKYAEYTGLRHLFTLLGYSGVTTMIVGVLTGSWGGNLFSRSWFGRPNPFFSAHNPLVILHEKLMTIDLLQKLIVALVLALLIGVINQMVSLVCLMISGFKKRDPVGAVLDSVFWLMALPALVILTATMFHSVPSPAVKAAVGTLCISGTGLVLTQGRDQKSIFAKLGAGLVSLYGVIGTYGCSSFLSDTLSYSRLLALGLVTSVIGMCSNIIADLARAIPWVGVPCTILILIGGHGANFFLGVLGSFVHSARLIFVEFFGRFYRGDAPAFAPIGTWTGRIRVTDARTVWAD